MGFDHGVLGTSTEIISRDIVLNNILEGTNGYNRFVKCGKILFLPIPFHTENLSGLSYLYMTRQFPNKFMDKIKILWHNGVRVPKENLHHVSVNPLPSNEEVLVKVAVHTTVL